MVYQSSNIRAMSKSIQNTRGQSDTNLNELNKHRNGASNTTSNNNNNNNQHASHRPPTRHSSMTHQHDDNDIKNAISYRQQHQARRESFTAVQNQQKLPAQRSHSVTALSHSHSNTNRQITPSNMHERKEAANAECGRQSSNEMGLYRNNLSFTMSTNSTSLVDIYANDSAEVMNMKVIFRLNGEIHPLS